MAQFQGTVLEADLKDGRLTCKLSYKYGFGYKPFLEWYFIIILVPETIMADGWASGTT